MIKNRRGLALVLQGPELEDLFGAEYLLLFVGPAQADQVVDQSFGQLPEHLEFIYGGCTVPFAQLLAVRSEYEGHMAELRDFVSESLV